MRARIIDRQDLLKIVDLLATEYQVVAPFRGRGRDTYFDLVTEANRGRSSCTCRTLTIRPKGTSSRNFSA